MQMTGKCTDGDTHEQYIWLCQGFWQWQWFIYCFGLCPVPKVY